MNATPDPLSLESTVRAHAPLLLKCLGVAAQGGDPVRAQSVRRGETALVFSIEAQGKKAAVKVFDAESAEGRSACKREAACQTTLRKTGLTTRILGYSETAGLVVTAWEEGDTLARTVQPDDATHVAWELGQWYRQYVEHSPGRAARSDWFSYLSGYRAQGLDARFGDHRAFLQGLRIDREVIAKNDAHLSNFIRTPSGDLVGLDFEGASWKPLGWDILLTARVLTKNFPNRMTEIVDALAEGWGAGAGPVTDDDLRRLMTLFAANTAFADLGPMRGGRGGGSSTRQTRGPSRDGPPAPL